jgi:hypothetical protein
MPEVHARNLPETVLRHFPAKVDAVRDLALRNQSFRDMCQELDDAERALARMEDLSPDIRVERLEECHGWIERLMQEMEDALAEAKVIPLLRPGPRRRPGF